MSQNKAKKLRKEVRHMAQGMKPGVLALAKEIVRPRPPACPRFIYRWASRLLLTFNPHENN